MSDPPQGTVGGGMGIPLSRVGPPPLGWESLRAGSSGAPGSRASQGLAGRPRRAPHLPPSAPATPRGVPGGPQPGFPSAARPWGRGDLGLALKRWETQTAKKRTQTHFRGRGRGLVQTRARSGPPRPESPSLGGSGSPHLRDSHLPPSRLRFFALLPLPRPFPCEALVPQPPATAGVSIPAVPSSSSRRWPRTRGRSRRGLHTCPNISCRNDLHWGLVLGPRDSQTLPCASKGKFKYMPP